MEPLDEQIVSVISDRIARNGITDPGLAAEMLDHFCCIAEEEMALGHNFEEAFNIAHQRICPGGMLEIQEELFFLLTFKKQMTMQKIIYGCGFAAAFAISMGLLFRFVHWPGADVLLGTGFTFLLLTSFGLFYRAVGSISKNTFVGNLRSFSGLFAAFFVATGSIFKIQHYPGANVQVMCGMLLLNFVFMPLLFWQMYRNSVASVAGK